jgi:Family of unknown function (DUF5994)
VNADAGSRSARGQVRTVTVSEVLPVERLEPPISAEADAASSPVVGPAPAARLRIKPTSTHTGMVNGAWWPRSRDLVRELPPLIAALDEVWGRIYHATVQVGMWPEFPKKIITGEHVLRVGWFDAEQDPDDICLISLRGGTRRDLLVVPPELDPETAERVMAAAASVDNFQSAGDLLAAARGDSHR